MLSIRDNFLETLKRDGHPDRLVNDFEPFKPVMNEPLLQYTRGNRVKGTKSKDQWGTVYLWPETQLYAFPSEEDKVCPDVTAWKQTVKVPDLNAHCGDPDLWKPAQEAAAQIDRSQYLVMGFMGTGVFEQAHNLMGIADTCLNTLLEPEALKELLAVIGEYRFRYTKLMVDNLHPDIIISHDDWGNKRSLFMSPDTWREFIKPHYYKMYQYMHDHGVIVMHHADCWCESIAEDMIDLGIDVWEGVVNTNDIAALQKKLDGRLTLMGGIDSLIDRPDSTEAEIRAEVRKVCDSWGQGSHFIPSMTYGLPGALYPHVNTYVTDEIRQWNLEHFGVG